MELTELFRLAVWWADLLSVAAVGRVSGCCLISLQVARIKATSEGTRFLISKPASRNLDPTTI